MRPIFTFMVFTFISCSLSQSSHAMLWYRNQDDACIMKKFGTLLGVVGFGAQVIPLIAGSGDCPNSPDNVCHFAECSPVYAGRAQAAFKGSFMTMLGGYMASVCQPHALQTAQELKAMLRRSLLNCSRRKIGKILQYSGEMCVRIGSPLLAMGTAWKTTEYFDLLIAQQNECIISSPYSDPSIMQQSAVAKWMFIPGATLTLVGTSLFAAGKCLTKKAPNMQAATETTPLLIVPEQPLV